MSIGTRSAVPIGITYAVLALLLPAAAAGQPVAAAHEQLHKYVATASVTAARSGVWSDPGIWGNGTVPGAGARVAIPSGVVVTVDREIPTPYDWVRVDGTLRFASNVSTALMVETVVAMGRIEIGTASAPIAPHVTARLTVRSSGQPLNHARDPLELTRGVIAMSPVSIYGAAKREISALAVLPAAGATSLQLDADPTGWRVGDSVLVAPTLYGQDEVVTVTAINGRTIGISPALRYTRTNVPTPLPGGPPLPMPIKVHVGNLTRNVAIRTDPAQAGDPKLQGHVMLMGGGHRIFHAAFVDLGRTLAHRPVTDPLLLPDGTRDPQLAPDCGMDIENVRGRYSLHVHNPGPFAPRSVFEGVVVSVQRNKGFKVGIQNHSAAIDIRRAVVHQIDGSGIFLEEGDEIGEVRDSLVVHSFGSGSATSDFPRLICLKNHSDPTYQEILLRRRMDLGHRGAGIWGQGGGVDFVGNILAGHDHAGMDFMSRPLDRDAPNTYAVWFPISLLPGGDWWLRPLDSGYGADLYKKKGILPISVPPFKMTDHHIYAIGSTHRGGSRSALFFESGLQIEKWAPRPKNLLARNLAWNVMNCYDFQYSSWIRVEDSACLAGERPPGVSASTNRYGMNARRQGGRHWDFVNVRVEGWANDPFRAEAYKFQNLWVNGQPWVETTYEACDGIDNDGDGLVDEGCFGVELPNSPAVPKPPTNIRIIRG